MSTLPNRSSRRFAAVLILSMGLTGTLTAAAPGSRISRSLSDRVATGGSGEMVDVIVTGSARTALKDRIVSRGGAAGRNLDLIDGFAARMPLGEVNTLASDPRVTSISIDQPVFAGKTSGAAAASASPVRRETFSEPRLTGAGVGVAVIDSGIHQHEALAGHITAWVDLTASRTRTPRTPVDPMGHGTHVAGIIAGTPSSGFDGGIAPGAHLVSVRVLDRNGAGRSSDVIAALDWCVAHANELGLRVVNMSLGQIVTEPLETDPLARAVERAWDAGLVLVTSAGNMGTVSHGYGTISSPGNHPLVITVGALDDQGTADRRDDATAPFSSRGPARFDMVLKPDLVASGTAVVSLRSPRSTLDMMQPTSRIGADRDKRYLAMSGSSMADGRRRPDRGRGRLYAWRRRPRHRRRPRIAGSCDRVRLPARRG